MALMLHTARRLISVRCSFKLIKFCAIAVLFCVCVCACKKIDKNDADAWTSINATSQENQFDADGEAGANGATGADTDAFNGAKGARTNQSGANKSATNASATQSILQDDAELAKKIKSDEDLNFWSDYPASMLAKEIVLRMTDEELLAQLYMFGWPGAEPDKLVTYWVEQRFIGSIKIFGWNTDDVEQVAKNITLMQQKAQKSRFKIPLYVATDQEGGWIRHVKGRTSETPGNLAIGASGLPYDSYKSGLYIARELRALGINMDFAPTADLYTDHDSTVIGPRSFGEYADQAAVLAVSFAKGLEDAGVIATAKHFPGHGDTGIDSHGKLPIIDINRETLFSRELVPFKALIDAKVSAIMSGHLAFPQITNTNEPASLSRYFLHTILREELGFEGLIISDDMMMNGATDFAGGLANAFALALRAGNNILCSSTTPRIDSDVWTQSIDLLKTDASFKNIVKDSAYRVIKSKLDYFKGENAVPIYPDLDAIRSLVPDREGEAFFLEQACRSITLYRKGTVPLLPREAGRVLLAGQTQDFFDAGVTAYDDASLFFFRNNLSAQDFETARRNLFARLDDVDTVIMLVMNNTSALLAQTLEKTGKRVVIISALSPTIVMTGFDWVDSIIMCYSYSSHSFLAAFQALVGNFTPTGVLPLTSGERYDLW